MPEPVRHFESLCKPSFFNSVTERYKEYDNYWTPMASDYGHSRDGKIKSYEIARMQNGVPGYETIAILEKGKNYTVECYRIKEKRFLREIESFVSQNLDKEKIAAYIGIQLNSLKVIIKNVEGISVEAEFNPIKNTVVELLQSLTARLSETYLNNPLVQGHAPKIRWKGDLKVLTTLLFELLHGQEKGKGKDKFKTVPIIEAEKKDLQELLISNFLDSEGNPLKPNTISDYLNTSKPGNRCKPGVRIEFPEK